VKAVSLTPLKSQCWQSIFGFSGVNDTAETDFGDF
jgi:hypothetical protein